MNTGVVAARYARALLLYVQENGTGAEVYDQASVLALRMKELPQLKDFLQDHDELSSEKKLELMAAALGEPLSDPIRRFVLLVIGRRRMEYLFRMLNSFVAQYRKEKGIKVGRLITAVPAEGLAEKLEEMVVRSSGADVRISSEVAPELIGGFVFEIDGMRLDASVGTHLRQISSRLIEKNNRIV